MARTKDQALNDQRHRQVLAAAAAVFKEKGFHAARTEDICAAAQLSPGTVFRLFENKQVLIEAIARLEIERYREQVAQLASEDGLRWMARLTAKHLQELLAPSAFDLGADSWLELSRTAQGRLDIGQLHADLHQALTAALGAGQRAGWVRAGLQPAGTATLILALFTGLSFDAEIRLPDDRAATARALADLFAHHVLA